MLLRLANAHYLGGRFAEAAALANDGLSHAARNSELTVELQILGSNIAPYVTDVETAMALAHDAVRGAEATGLPRLELEAARCHAHVRFNGGLALSPGLLDRIETLEALLVDEAPVDVVYLGHLNSGRAGSIPRERSSSSGSARPRRAMIRNGPTRSGTSRSSTGARATGSVAPSEPPKRRHSKISSAVASSLQPSRQPSSPHIARRPKSRVRWRKAC